MGAPAPSTSPVPEELSPLVSPYKENELPKVTNPGSYEELLKKTRELFPAMFDGFRLNVGKPLTSAFQVSHTVNLSGGPQGSSYKFGTTYVGGSQEDPNPIVLGEVDGNGNLSAQIMYTIASSWKSKLVVQTQEKEIAVVQADLEYKSSQSTANFTAVNIDILRETGICVGHYLHRIAENFDLGAEVMYQYGKGTSSYKLSLGGRYSQPKWFAAASLSTALNALHVSYFHKANENIQAGVEYEYNEQMQDNGTVNLVYQVEVPKANVTFRALVDSNWTVGSVFEKRLDGMPFLFSLSGQLNHSKNSARFGIGLQIG